MTGIGQVKENARFNQPAAIPVKNVVLNLIKDRVCNHKAAAVVEDGIIVKRIIDDLIRGCRRNNRPAEGICIISVENIVRNERLGRVQIDRAAVVGFVVPEYRVYDADACLEDFQGTVSLTVVCSSDVNVFHRCEPEEGGLG